MQRSAIATAALLTACASPSPPPPAPAPTPRPSTTATVPAAGRLNTPGAVRSMTEMRQQAARRIVAANPNGTYVGTVPDILLAIPVLEIELNADGSIRNIDVLRRPGQAPETLQMAIDAVRRAAPFGDVSRAPKPWKFAETFLFNNERKFKPRTLDE
ncbi:hypothetical protein DZC73_23730 [Albitalea terrae]|uniref:TonB C-terminal domain-containing protein n=1 Tax=Piscinibacter terrae TaxID=2496871 RepID=A0A3N7HJN0_9BURK|nr:hypothetical protein DZC73_23730 [Albitalea terrae]